jgi:hypothetical protein
MRRVACALALLFALLAIYAGALCVGRWLGGVLFQYIAQQYGARL